LLVLKRMQQRHGTIEAHLNILGARGCEVYGSDLLFGKRVMMLLERES